MAIPFREKFNQFPKEVQEQIQARAEVLIAEERSRQDLRLARKLAQERMAELLQTKQEDVSQLEERSDLFFSTLREAVQAMGGDLRLIVEFPDRPPVVVDSFEDLDEAD